MKIIIFEVEDWECPHFSDLEEQHDVVFQEDPLDEENVDDFADADIVSVFIYSKVTEKVLEKMTNLKLVATRSTGADHIDTEVCEKRDIHVSNVPSYGKNTVAEHTFALLLNISKHLYEGIERTRKGEFDMTGLQGFDLLGKTLGVIGTGDIGQHTIQIAKGFGMEVVAFDVVKQEEFAETMGFEYLEMNDLLSRADIVTIHVPLTEKTRHLLGKEEFAAMKDGMILLNTSRGEIVDQTELIEALSTGKVAAAGLDVLAEEPVVREEAELLRSVTREKKREDYRALLADHALMRLRNVYITPHTAFNTREALERIIETTVDNIKTFTKSGKPKDKVAG